MFKISVGFMIAAFLMSPISSSVRADDVKITNQSKQPVTFEVFIQDNKKKRKGKITLQPGESKNPVETSLSHNMLVVIYAYDSDTKKVDCGLSVYQALLPIGYIYLHRVSGAYPPYRTCDYTSNLPSQCDCFVYHSTDEPCYDACSAVTNAQVNLTYRPKQVDAP